MYYDAYETYKLNVSWFTQMFYCGDWSDHKKAKLIFNTALSVWIMFQQHEATVAL